MQRVIVIGCGGAGKSTFARALSDRTGLPIVYLDQLFWQPGWVSCSREEFEAKHAAALAADQWIIDGNYNRTIPTRVASADTIVVLDLPRRACMLGILKRFVKGRLLGARRPDMSEGCPEKLDWAFIKWIWKFRDETRPDQMRMIDEQRDTKDVLVLRSRREVKRWLATVNPT